jgi:hypothetical protein
VHNLRFCNEVVAGRLVFDYRLRPGASPTTNALEIMLLEGLPVDDDPPTPVHRGRRESGESFGCKALWKCLAPDALYIHHSALYDGMNVRKSGMITPELIVI